MREIKFRVWCVGKKEWEKDEWAICSSGCLVELKTRTHHFLNNQFHIVSQYTGLKDKNGKEIFEGDIVKQNNRNKEVKYKDGYFYVDWADVYDAVLGKFKNNQYGRVEVIGNIYENPELLK